MKAKGKELRTELGYLRDNLIEGIHEGKTSSVKDGLDMYEELISTFIKKMKEHGSPYDKKRTMQELATFERGWSEIEWIRDDLRQIIDATIITENIHVIHDVLYFPLHLASLAFLEGDYYIFHQFINWVPYCYGASLGVKDPKVQELIVDRCWRWLREIVEFIIRPEIEGTLTVEEIEKEYEFLAGITLVFNQLFKRTFDKRRLDHFKKFLQGFRSIFKDQEDQNPLDEANEIQWRLEGSQLTEEERINLKKELSLKKKYIDGLNDLKQRKALILYGLNAWILHHYDAGSLSLENFKSWHENIGSFGNLKETWELYLKARDHEIGRELSWDWWEIDEHLDDHPEGWVGEVGFENYSQSLCCLKCLEALKELTMDQRREVSIPLSPEILYLAGGENSPFGQTLKQIEGQTEKWIPIIGNDGVAAIPSFREILERSLEAQRQEDIRILIGAELSDEKIKEVKQNILKEWRKNAAVRDIIKTYRIYEYVNVPPEGKDFFVINQIHPKEIYIKESRISTHGSGSHFGRSLADGENELVLSTLISSLPSFADKTISREDTLQAINEVLAKLEESGLNPIILILKSWSTRRAIEGSEDFKKLVGVNNSPRSIGNYRNRPVFSLHYRGSPVVLILDMQKIGIWRQYKPKRIFAEEELISDEISFYIKAYTRESALELIRKQPELRLNKEGIERPEGEVLIELQQRVHFRLVQQFEFEIISHNTGYKIIIER